VNNGITDAIDASAANINNAINIGANAIAGTNFNVSGAGAIVGISLDTGNGANELFAMDQNVLQASSPTFAGLTLNGNLDMTDDLVLNIGAAGTDFTAGGGLTLAELLTVNDDVDLVFAAGENLNLDGATTANTTTGGVIDLNVNSGDVANIGLNIDQTQNNGATAGRDSTAQKITLTANDADGDMFGI